MLGRLVRYDAASRVCAHRCPPRRDRRRLSFPSRAVESPALFLFFYSSFCRPAHWILLQLLQNCSAKKTADIIIIYYLLLEYLKIICRYVPYSVLRTVCVMWMLLPETKLPFLGTHLVAPYQLFLGARAT